MNIFRIFLISTVFFYAKLSILCSCMPWPTAEKAFASYDAIFSGRVIAKQKFSNNGFNQVIYKFRVGEAFKGIRQRSVKLVTNESSAACGYNFNLGTSYLVYAHQNTKSGILSTNLCSGTRERGQAYKEIQKLRYLKYQH